MTQRILLRLATITVLTGALTIALFSLAEANATPAQTSQSRKTYFEPYILKAVDYLYKNYRLLGYDLNKQYTHHLPYGPYGEIIGTSGHKTMCVAAQVEVILTALDIYARETGDRSAYDFLPIQSWRGTSVHDIKGHIWVNSRFHSNGTADALRNFGMGEVVPFEKLRPGSFLNFSRTNRTGHAVVFIAFLDRQGNEYSAYNPKVIGFKYFSAQGRRDPIHAGLDFRYAVFSQFGCMQMPYKHDCKIIYSRHPSMLNAGRMFAPSSWHHVNHLENFTEDPETLPDSVFNADFFTGDTVEE